MQRKLIVFMMISVDGYYEAPGHNIDWHTVDADFNVFAIEQIQSVDTLIFGRMTYEGMAAYWPTPEAMQNDPEVTGYMNATQKIVISNSLETAGWANTRLIKGDVAAAELKKLKRQPGKDLLILGSGDLVVSLAEQGLMDEYRLMLAPVALGAGKSFFTGLSQQIKLELIKSTTFKSGNVLLYYRPA
jgi:dihydrofolate reductase